MTKIKPIWIIIGIIVILLFTKYYKEKSFLEFTEGPLKSTDVVLEYKTPDGIWHTYTPSLFTMMTMVFGPFDIPPDAVTIRAQVTITNTGNIPLDVSSGLVKFTGKGIGGEQLKCSGSATWNYCCHPEDPGGCTCSENCNVWCNLGSSCASGTARAVCDDGPYSGIIGTCNIWIGGSSGNPYAVASAVGGLAVRQACGYITVKGYCRDLILLTGDYNLNPSDYTNLGAGQSTQFLTDEVDVSGVAAGQINTLDFEITGSSYAGSRMQEATMEFKK